MRIVTTGNLSKLFKENDPNTILRIKNIRNLINDNDFNFHKVGQNYIIDYDDFMTKVNPKNIEHRFEIPKIRSIQSATREYNQTHTKKISYHVVEKCIADNLVAYVKTKRYYLINYQELEIVIENNNFKKRVKEI